MKRLPLAAALAALFLSCTAHAAKFTYHGELLDGDVPAEGSYDLRVRSFSDPQRLHPLGEATEVLGVMLTNGSFSTQLDLPTDADGITWIDVAVRKSATGEDYVALGQAQPMPTTNSTCPGAWALDGNSGAPAGSFLGMVDAGAALELKANNRRVAHFDSALSAGYIDAPRIALGSSANQATAEGASVLGGGATHDGDTSHPDPSPNNLNIASAPFATIAGGIGNTASGWGSTVSGGRSNCAGGTGSWAGGSSAKVRPGTNAGSASFACQNGVSSSGDANGDEGTFIWADNHWNSFVSTGPNQFLVRASGGVMFNTNVLANSTYDLVIGARAAGDADADLVLKSRSDRRGVIYLADENGSMYFSAPSATGDTRFIFGGGPVSGRYLVTGANGAHLTTGGTWTNGSSRAFKHAFEAIDVSDVLARVVALPLTRWQYRDSSEGLHLGPMAEDFAAAFGLGGSAQHISTVDADGVALAAIQGLNAKLEAENAALHTSLDALAARLAALEARKGK